MNILYFCSLFEKLPIVIDAKHLSPQSRPRYFWGNIPGELYEWTFSIILSVVIFDGCILFKERVSGHYLP